MLNSDLVGMRVKFNTNQKLQLLHLSRLHIPKENDQERHEVREEGERPRNGVAKINVVYRMLYRFERRIYKFKPYHSENEDRDDRVHHSQE